MQISIHNVPTLFGDSHRLIIPNVLVVKFEFPHGMSFLTYHPASNPPVLWSFGKPEMRLDSTFKDNGNSVTLGFSKTKLTLYNLTDRFYDQLVKEMTDENTYTHRKTD